MIGAALGCAWVVRQANSSPEPQTWFLPFLLLFILLFATTGIGNGSTFRMIAIIFSKDLAGPVLGWTSAVAAYGAFIIPTIFAMQIKAGTPERALIGFSIYYVTCLALNWWFYAICRRSTWRYWLAASVLSGPVPQPASLESGIAVCWTGRATSRGRTSSTLNGAKPREFLHDLINAGHSVTSRARAGTPRGLPLVAPSTPRFLRAIPDH